MVLVSEWSALALKMAPQMKVLGRSRTNLMQCRVRILPNFETREDCIIPSYLEECVRREWPGAQRKSTCLRGHGQYPPTSRLR